MRAEHYLVEYEHTMPNSLNVIFKATLKLDNPFQPSQKISDFQIKKNVVIPWRKVFGSDRIFENPNLLRDKRPH